MFALAWWDDANCLRQSQRMGETLEVPGCQIPWTVDALRRVVKPWQFMCIPSLPDGSFSSLAVNIFSILTL